MMAEGSRGTDGQRTVVVGLVADPGLPTEIAEAVAPGLPDLLAHQVDDGVTWQVEVSSEALSLDDSGELMIPESGQSMHDRGWDMLVGLTELPRRMRRRPLVLEVDVPSATAWLSLPALGGIRLKSRAADAVVVLVERMFRRSSEPVTEQLDTLEGPAATTGVAPVPDANGQPGDVKTRSMRGRGARLRLLFGMVRVNRPWRLVGSLDNVFAAAAATAAFGVFYASVWNMADTLSLLRLLSISVVVIVSMVGWLIFHNGLWERSGSHGGYSDQPRLYNATMVLTLLIGVACMYALLFGATLLASLAVISGEYLEATLGHPVDITDYMQIAWLASCMGIAAGALGSNFESEAAVRKVAYGRRQRERVG